MKMRPIFRKNLLLSFLFITLGFLILLFGDVVSAQGTQTWYTDFYVVGGVNGVSNLSTSGHDGEFEFVLTNHSVDPISGNIYFVDAVEISDNVYACLSNSETDVFGQYLTGDQYFQIEPESTLTGVVDYDFPDSYSGTYHGCILYSINGGDSVINMSSRKAYFLNILLSAKDVDICMVANLGSRGNANTSNNNGYESEGKMLFYSPGNHEEPLYSGYVFMDHEGSGILSGVQVMAGCYDVVYKGWHHLASYIPNFCINQGECVNFVTGLNLEGVGEFDETLPYNGGLAYQRAGDMPRSTNDYDNVINGTDLSVLYGTGCPYMTSPGHAHVCDLNNDGRVDSSDASVIIANTNWRDSAYCGIGTGLICDQETQFLGFGYVDYFGQ